METAFWIVTAIVATVYITGWMLTNGWLFAKRRPLGRFLRNMALFGATALFVFAILEQI